MNSAAKQPLPAPRSVPMTDRQRLRGRFRAEARRIQAAAPGPMDFDTLVRLTMATRPPDFGVSYITAVAKIGALLHTPAEERRADSPTRRMWLEMCLRVEARMAEPYNERLFRAVQHVLTRERPTRWHISYNTACRWLSSN